MDLDLEKYAKVECITGLRPWATVQHEDPKKTGLQPLENGQVVWVPRKEADTLKRNRHAVEVR